MDCENCIYGDHIRSLDRFTCKRKGSRVCRETYEHFRDRMKSIVELTPEGKVGWPISYRQEDVVACKFYRKRSS